MAADVITRFRLETTQFDSKLRDTAKTLQDIARTAQSGGKNFNDFSKKSIEAARALGTVQSGAANTKDKLKDLVGSFNDAAKAYNSLNETAKKGEFGKALEASLQKLQQDIKQTKEELYGLGDAVKSKSGGLFGNLGDKMGGAMQVFAGNVMTKIAGMGVELAGEMGEMITQGIELAKQGEGIRIAFERLGRGDILDGLRKATHGTVTDLELMKAAVKFNDFKLPLDELATMLSFAQQKAKDTGQSVDYLVESIVNGLGRQSTQILDNLGLSQSEVKRRTAEVGDMTKAVGEIIREQMSAAGDYVETAADRAAQAHVSLQNKMEELGRKFSPLSEASNNFWTSMKIGILDIIGGPLTDLLNKLTQVGRMMNTYSQMGGSGKVGRMITNLSGAREGNRQSIYQQQQQQFWRYINPREQYLKDIDAWHRGERNKALQGRINAIRDKYGSLDTTKIQAEVDASKKMLSDYNAASKPLLNPVKVIIDTDDATRNVSELKKQLAELQAQRKKVSAGSEKAKQLDTQIRNLKADIKLQEPGALNGGGRTLSKSEQAQQKFEQAQKDYNQALDQATLEVKAGTINSAEAKKKELQATESLWKSIGDARETYDSPKLKEAQAKVEQDIIRLGGEVTKAVEAQKQIDQASREHAAAQKKLSEAHIRLSEAQKSGNLKEIYAAEKKVTAAQQEVKRLETIKVNVETGTVDLPDIPKEIEQVVSTKVGEVVTPDIAEELTQVVNIVPGTVNLPDIPKEQEVNIIANTENISAEITHLKEKLGGLEIGTLDFNKTQANLVDMTTLQTIINEHMKNGLNIDSSVTHNIFSRIKDGFNIDDNEWRDLVNKINEKLKEMKLEPISIEFKTGEIAKDGKIIKSSYKDAASAVNSLGSALSGLDDPGAKIAGTIAQAIANIALAFSSADLKEGESGNIWYWIAATAAGMATMISTISAIHSATGYQNGGVVKGYQRGGVVKGYAGGKPVMGYAGGGSIGSAISGGMITGSTYSNDQIPIMANAGEVVLTNAMTTTLASKLNDQSNTGYVPSHISGEQIYIALNRFMRRSGRGEIVTWKS